MNNIKDKKFAKTMCSLGLQLNIVNKYTHIRVLYAVWTQNMSAKHSMNKVSINMSVYKDIKG